MTDSIVQSPLSRHSGLGEATGEGDAIVCRTDPCSYQTMTRSSIHPPTTADRCNKFGCEYPNRAFPSFSTSLDHHQPHSDKRKCEMSVHQRCLPPLGSPSRSRVPCHVKAPERSPLNELSNLNINSPSPTETLHCPRCGIPVYNRQTSEARACRLTIDHDHLSTTNTRTMPAPLSDLTGVPIEILEQIILCLPGRDIVKMEEVRNITARSSRAFVDFAPCELIGQLALSRPRP